MAKQNIISDKDQVLNYFIGLSHPLLNCVEILRDIILQTDPLIGERIKWNSISFYYTGEMEEFNPKEYKRDLIVFNLIKKDCVMLIFPTGDKITDNSGLLEGMFEDTRKVIKFTSAHKILQRKEDLQNIIKNWISKIDK